MTTRLYPVAIAGGLLAGLLALSLLAAAAGLLAAAGRSSASCAGGEAAPASQAGLREIPSRLLPIYREAADAYRLGPDGWAWLAAINRLETDFGRDTSTSSAGAIGWMQFEPATWAEYGVDANGDGRRDPYDPADAITAAARYLRSVGAPADWQRAVRAYNGGPANAGSSATLAYWQNAVRSATAYAAVQAPATEVERSCQPCPGPDPAAGPDTLVAYDPSGVPNAGGRPGFTPGPSTVYTVGQEPQIAARLDLLGRTLNLRLTGISGYRSPSHSLAVGGSPNDPHTRGQASDTPGVESVPETELERFGLTRPFDRLLPAGGHTNPAEADHIQLLAAEAAVLPSGQVAAGAAAVPSGQFAAGAAVPSDQIVPGGAGPTSAECSAGGAVPLAPGDRAVIQADGRAAAPASAPPQVRAMIAAANQLIGRPYLYGGGHADFRLAAGYDCSSSVSFALHGAGFLTGPEDSVTLEGFGAPGAGLWVTVYANPGHAFVYIAGIRLDTSAQAGDGRFDQSGPRWRPATRSTAGFVARHPPGL